MELQVVENSLENIQTSVQRYLKLYETELANQEMFIGKIKDLNNELEKLIFCRAEIQDTLQGCG